MPSVGARSVQARRIRVLLVDDSVETLAALSHLLVQLFPIQIVAQAEDGRAALALVEQLEPDLCITDIQMPVMDGLQLVKLVRQRHPTVRSIVISVHDRPAFYEASVKNGADAFIPKERLPDDLPSLLNRLFPDTAPETPSTPIISTVDVPPDRPVKENPHPQGPSPSSNL